MREIKFRAWCRQELHMFYQCSDFGFEFGGGDSVIRIYSSDGVIDIVNDRDLKFMQYTGLKDKFGNEIYEGDLLRHSFESEWDGQNYTAYEVFFHDGDMAIGNGIGFRMSRTHHQGSVCGGIIPAFLPKTTSKMLVIGNIYENPELLEDKT